MQVADLLCFLLAEDKDLTVMPEEPDRDAVRTAAGPDGRQPADLVGGELAERLLVSGVLVIEEGCGHRLAPWRGG